MQIYMPVVPRELTEVSASSLLHERPLGIRHIHVLSRLRGTNRSTASSTMYALGILQHDYRCLNHDREANFMQA